MGVIKNIADAVRKSFGSYGYSNLSFFDGQQNPAELTGSDLVRLNRNIAYKCIDIIAQEVSRLEIKTFDKNTGKEVNSPLKALLKNPNPELQLTQMMLFDFVQRHLEQVGEHFWILELGGKTGFPLKIHPTIPDRWEVYAKDGGISGYSYMDDRMKKVPLEVEEVVFFRMPNPANIYRGYGMLEAASNYVQVEEKTTRLLNRFLHNNATPAGILNVKNVGGKPEFEALKREWKKENGGIDNKGKIAFIREAELSYQQIGSPLEHVANEVLLDLQPRMIQKMFSVSDQMMQEYKDSNYNNGGTALASFRREVAIPKMEKIVAVLNMALGQKYGVDILVGNDVEQTQEERINYYKNAWWLSANEIRAEEGWELSQDPEANQIRVPINQAPIATVPTPMVDNESRGGVTKLYAIKKTIVKTTTVSTSKKKVHKKRPQASLELSLAQRKFVLWKAYDIVEAQWTGRIVVEVQKLLREQMKSVLKEIGVTKVKQFDLNEETAKWVSGLMPLYTAMAQDQAGTTMDFIGLTSNQLPANTKTVLQSRIQRFAGELNQRHQQELSQVISESISRGETLQQRAKAVELYYGKNSYEAERVARTESAKISNMIAVDSFRNSPYVTGKQWYANPGACEFCRALDGTIVSLDEDYLSLGQSLVGSPEDVSEDPGILNIDYEAIGEPPVHPNCRCRALPWSQAFDETGTFVASGNNDFFQNLIGGEEMLRRDGGSTVSEHASAQNQFTDVPFNGKEQDFMKNYGVKIDDQTKDALADKWRAQGVEGRYDPKTKTIFMYVKNEHTDEVFYHEFGHAIDDKFGEVSGKAALNAIKADRDNIVVRRIQALGFSESESIDLMEGVTIEHDKKVFGFGPEQLTYLNSPSEVFAEGYSQYKLEPLRFKAYSPNLYKLFEELFNGR